MRSKLNVAMWIHLHSFVIHREHRPKIGKFTTLAIVYVALGKTFLAKCVQLLNVSWSMCLCASATRSLWHEHCRAKKIATTFKWSLLEALLSRLVNEVARWHNGHTKCTWTTVANWHNGIKHARCGHLWTILFASGTKQSSAFCLHWHCAQSLPR